MPGVGGTLFPFRINVKKIVATKKHKRLRMFSAHLLCFLWLTLILHWQVAAPVKFLKSMTRCVSFQKFLYVTNAFGITFGKSQTA